MSLPAVPEGIDPDAPVIEIYHMQCRTAGCVERGPWTPSDDLDHPAHLWDVEHARATGHRSYYRWALTRQTARIG